MLEMISMFCFVFKACVLVPFIALQVLLGPRGWASVCVCVTRLPSSVNTENYTDIHFLKIMKGLAVTFYRSLKFQKTLIIRLLV